MIKCSWLVLVLALAGCTAGDALTLRKLTVDDGAKYVEENHDWRREIRSLQRQIVRDTVIIKGAQCQGLLLQNNNPDEAIACLNTVDMILARAYPHLATIEAIKAGAEAVRELRRVFSEQNDSTEVLENFDGQ